eukprot:7389591-Prymnesium_polylepis.4
MVDAGAVHVRCDHAEDGTKAGEYAEYLRGPDAGLSGLALLRRVGLRGGGCGASKAKIQVSPITAAEEAPAAGAEKSPTTGAEESPAATRLAVLPKPQEQKLEKFLALTPAQIKLEISIETATSLRIASDTAVNEHRSTMEFEKPTERIIETLGLLVGQPQSRRWRPA